MPTKPARPEKKPPVRNANGTQGFWMPNAASTAKITARMTNTIVTTLYCCLRYAIAPFLTYSAISFMVAVPSLSFIICRKKSHAKNSAATAAAGTR